MSKIFGELFFSIDPDYRGTKGKVRTQYANMLEESNDFDDALGITTSYGHFFVPENVYIIGTMNDIENIQGLSAAYHIGGSYFAKLSKYSGKPKDEAYECLWNNHLKPLLTDYLRGLPNLDAKQIHFMQTTCRWDSVLKITKFGTYNANVS